VTLRARCDAKSSLGDAESSLGDEQGDTILTISNQPSVCGFSSQSLRKLVEDPFARQWVQAERGPAARALMSGLARLLVHPTGSSDALVAFHHLTSIGEEGLYLLTLLSHGDGGDLETVLVRLAAMAGAPQAELSQVASPVLATLQSFLHGRVVADRRERPDVNPGAVWSI
jgi:hypothetical protein